MRRFLIVAAVGLLIANAVVIGAWIYHDELQEAGMLPTVQLPSRADFASEPLPAVTADAGADRSEDTPAAPAPVAQRQSELVDCVLAGSFNTRDLAVEAGRRIAARSGAVHIVADSVATDPDYLVFVAPGPDPAAPRDLVRELEAQGMSSHVMTGGKYANGVSVGVFRSQERAAAQQQRVAKLGHNVSLAVIDRKRLVYRVRVRDAPLSALADLPRLPCNGDSETLVAPAPPAQ